MFWSTTLYWKHKAVTTGKTWGKTRQSWHIEQKHEVEKDTLSSKRNDDTYRSPWLWRSILWRLFLWNPDGCRILCGIRVMMFGKNMKTLYRKIMNKYRENTGPGWHAGSTSSLYLESAPWCLQSSCCCDNCQLDWVNWVRRTPSPRCRGAGLQGTGFTIQTQNMNREPLEPSPTSWTVNFEQFNIMKRPTLTPGKHGRCLSVRVWSSRNAYAAMPKLLQDISTWLTQTWMMKRFPFHSNSM